LYSLEGHELWNRDDSFRDITEISLNETKTYFAVVFTGPLTAGNDYTEENYILKVYPITGYGGKTFSIPVVYHGIHGVLNTRSDLKVEFAKEEEVLLTFINESGQVVEVAVNYKTGEMRRNERSATQSEIDELSPLLSEKQTERISPVNSGEHFCVLPEDNWENIHRAFEQIVCGELRKTMSEEEISIREYKVEDCIIPPPLYISPDGRRGVFCYLQRCLVFFDADRPPYYQILESSTAMEVVVSPSGKYIAAAMNQSTFWGEHIKAWRFTNGQYVPIVLPEIIRHIKSVTYVSDEGAMASSEWYGVTLVNLNTGKSFFIMNGSQIECGLAVTHNFGYGGYDSGALEIVDTEKAELVTSFLTLPGNLDGCDCRFLIDPEDELKEFLAHNGAII
jgi:hypothetical protein